ncbi:peptidoglycan-associated lipoprotein Pal [Sphingosinicella terrae]|uniref:peptidoglycan-associated lipoprotein Pal n=1 Tax=Sphingosinicella terrae TaxID=2172047 RepID=UPI000E0D6F72|nr:peptidoglycan-associated lipoprotein Pal [Sphingosinicella terrae]
MKKSMISLVAAAASLSLVAGCAPRTRELPPEPPSSSTPGDLGNQDSTIGGTAVPGSRADFLQSVPSDRVLFGFDSYSIDAEARAILDAQAQWLNRNPNVRVTIEGHADERGTREYNLALGDRRANAARDYLQSRGIAANRMQTISWGKERPAVEGSNESAWAQNRRAVTVVPE